MRPLIQLALLATLAACGSPAPSSSFRHAGLVDRTVIRSLTSEGAGLPPDVMQRARVEAVESIAESVDGLDATQVEDLRLDIAIAEVRQTPTAVRARCLVTVSTVGPPERTRSILQGAVTVGGATEETLGEAAARSVRSALRRLPQALTSL